MYVDITELAQEPYGKLPFSFTVDAKELSIDGEDYEIEGEVHVSGHVRVAGERFRAEGMVTCMKKFLCDRCLKPTREAQRHSFSEEFSREARPEDEWEKLINNCIDITSLVRDTIIASQPLAKLCKPDCKGLCPVCGQDLNEGSCHCDTFVPDPRMAALKSLLSNDKEE